MGGGGGGGGREGGEGHSQVAELDAVEVEHALGVGQDEGIEGQDLEHLQRGHQRAATLLDHVTDWEGQNHQ